MPSLLTLPAELRNAIYTYVFIQPSSINFLRTPPLEGTDDSQIPVEPLSLGLLLTCCQTYYEARLLPFSLNVFCVNTFTRIEELNARLTQEQRAAILEVDGHVCPCHWLNVLDVCCDFKSRNITFLALLPGVKRASIQGAYSDGGRRVWKRRTTQRLLDWIDAEGENGVHVTGWVA